MAPRRAGAVVKAIVTAGILSALITSCGESTSSPSGARYSVRALVRGVSQLDQHPRRLRVQHEAVEDLVGVNGTIEPMDSMTMTMVLWDQTKLPGSLEVGDKVQLVLDVDWLRTPVALIVDLKPLPRDTVLKLRNGKKGAGHPDRAKL